MGNNKSDTTILTSRYRGSRVVMGRFGTILKSVWQDIFIISTVCINQTSTLIGYSKLGIVFAMPSGNVVDFARECFRASISRAGYPLIWHKLKKIPSVVSRTVRYALFFPRETPLQHALTLPFDYKTRRWRQDLSLRMISQS